MRDQLLHLGRPGLICLPFLRITGQEPSTAWLLRQFHRTTNIPLSVQLLGNHAQHLALAARVLSDAGADVVDLNLGCPTQQAIKKGVGAALLSSVDSISRIVAGMRAACRCRLSVKIRAGDSAPDKVIPVAKAIEAAGADFLIIHPRTRCQAYRGVADWNVVGRVKSHLTIPVVGNGDLWYASDALRLMHASGVDAVMIGRPVLRNPFLFRQIEELMAGQPAFVPKGRDIVEHVERLSELMEAELKHTQKGPSGALKEQIQYLLRAVPNPLRLPMLHSTMRACGLQEILEAIQPLRDIAFLDLAADGPLRLETSPLDPF
jgi:tRNA-dihydrouridine synthase